MANFTSTAFLSLGHHFPDSPLFYQAIIALMALPTAYKVLKLTSSKHTKLRKGSDDVPPAQNDILAKDFIQSNCGLWLYTRRWIPKDDVVIKGVIFIAHGFGEHCSRYDHIATQFIQKGYAVFSMDHQGHGRSEGDRAFVEHFDDYAKDYVNYIQLILAEKLVRVSSSGKSTTVELDKLPRFLFGHSMGTLVTLRSIKVAASRGITWNGVVLTGTALKVAGADSLLATIAVKILSSIVPKMTLAPLDPNLVCTNKLIVSQYIRDPLVYQGGSCTRLSYEMVSMMKVELMDAANFKLPVFMGHGQSDQICFPEGASEFHDRCGSKDKTIKMYPNEFHEILNSDLWHKILNEITSWIDARCKK